jgi:hypothetical protein
LQAPTGTGDFHPLFDQMAAGTFDNAGQTIHIMPDITDKLRLSTIVFTRCTAPASRFSAGVSPLPVTYWSCAIVRADGRTCRAGCYSRRLDSCLSCSGCRAWGLRRCGTCSES